MLVLFILFAACWSLLCLFCCSHTVIRLARTFSVCIMSSGALKALKCGGSDKRLTSKRIRACLHLDSHLNYTLFVSQMLWFFDSILCLLVWILKGCYCKVFIRHSCSFKWCWARGTFIVWLPVIKDTLRWIHQQ